MPNTIVFHYFDLVMSSVCRFSGGLQSGREADKLGHKVRSMGDAEERSFGTTVAHPAGKEIAQPDAACQLPTLPYHGNQSKGEA